MIRFIFLFMIGALTTVLIFDIGLIVFTDYLKGRLMEQIVQETLLEDCEEILPEYLGDIIFE